MCGGDGGSGAHSAAADRLYNIQGDLAVQGHQLYMDTYFPLEKEAIQDVRNLSDPGVVQGNVDRSVQDVAEQFSKVKAERERNALGLGINPADGAYSSGSRQFALGQAGASAGASNNTRLAMKNMQLQAKLGLINTGRGLSNQTQQGLSSAASGFSGMANSERAAAAQESAGEGQAVGTAIGTWGALYSAGAVSVF